MQFLIQLSKSKTVVVNALTVVIGVLGYLQGDQIIAQHPEVVAALVTAVGALNIVLRIVTKVPVMEK